MQGAGQRHQQPQQNAAFTVEAVVPGQIGFIHDHDTEQGGGSGGSSAQQGVQISHHLKNAQNRRRAHDPGEQIRAEPEAEGLGKQTHHAHEPIQAVSRPEGGQLQRVKAARVSIFFDGEMVRLAGRVKIIHAGPGNIHLLHHTAKVAVVDGHGMSGGNIHA